MSRVYNISSTEAGAACALLGLAPRRAAKAALLAPLTAALAPEANCGDLLVEATTAGAFFLAGARGRE